MNDLREAVSVLRVMRFGAPLLTPREKDALDAVIAALATSAAQPEGGDAVGHITEHAAAMLHEFARPSALRSVSVTVFAKPQAAGSVPIFTRPAPAQQAVTDGNRYVADGPQGWFTTNDLKLARALLKAYDRDNDWTITDLTRTAVKAAEGAK